MEYTDILHFYHFLYVQVPRLWLYLDGQIHLTQGDVCRSDHKHSATVVFCDLVEFSESAQPVPAVYCLYGLIPQPDQLYVQHGPLEQNK